MATFHPDVAETEALRTDGDTIHVGGNVKTAVDAFVEAVRRRHIDVALTTGERLRSSPS